MRNLFVVLLAAFWCSDARTVTSKSNNVSTIVITEEMNETARVDLRSVPKPHHLFIGRCYPFYPVLHQEKIVLNNDGKSHVSAVIRVNIEGEAYITCVNIFDETSGGKNGYPSYIGGGLGRNFVEFGVVTVQYGSGFEFYVQIFGYSNKEDFKRALRVP